MAAASATMIHGMHHPNPNPAMLMRQHPHAPVHPQTMVPHPLHPHIMIPQGSLNIMPLANRAPGTLNIVPLASNMGVQMVAVPQEPAGTQIEVDHNGFYNLNEVLVKNIHECSWFKATALSLNTLDEIFEEIKKEVQFLEPVTRNKTPSHAFCLLYRLMQLKLSEESLNRLLNHGNPFIKGIGYLYVRFLVPSKKLWMWYRSEFHKKDLIQVSNGGHRDTVYSLLAKLLVEKNFYGQPLPKIPIPVHRKYRMKILDMKLRDERNDKYRSLLKAGVEVEAMYHEDTMYYTAQIKEELDDGNYEVLFTDYDESQEVSLGQIRIPKSLKRKRRYRSRSRSNGRRRRDRDRDRRSRDRYDGRRARKRDRRTRSRSRSRSDSMSESPDLDKIIRDEDQKNQVSSNAKHCAKKVQGYKMGLSTPTLNAGRLFEPEIFTRSALVVNNPQNKIVDSASRRRRIKELRRNQEADMREKRKEKDETHGYHSGHHRPERRVAPSQKHLKRMKNLKDRYGDASANERKKK